MPKHDIIPPFQIESDHTASPRHPSSTFAFRNVPLGHMDSASPSYFYSPCSRSHDLFCPLFFVYPFRSYFNTTTFPLELAISFTGTTISSRKHIPMLHHRYWLRAFLYLAVLTYLFEYMDGIDDGISRSRIERRSVVGVRIAAVLVPFL